jgi:hypothetical protein
MKVGYERGDLGVEPSTVRYGRTATDDVELPRSLTTDPFGRLVCS